MPLNVVLYQPEIPQNTGNIMRTCAGTNILLHLIKPFGFKLSQKHIRRTSVNYLESVDYHVYEDYSDFLDKNKGRFIFLTRYGKKTPKQFDFSNVDENIYLIFGRESTGIPKEILRNNLDNCVRIPTNDKIRSLNLSNCVSIMVFEALGQQNYPNLYKEEPETLKGPDWLLED